MPPGATSMSFSPVLIPRIVVWVLLFGLLTITRADPDLWGHVRFGLDILRDGALPVGDIYSFTSDRPWINHEWLAEVLMGGAYASGGAPGLVLLKVAILSLAFALVGWELRAQRLAPLPADLLLGVAVLGSFFITATVRPQIFSALCFSALLLALRRADDGHRAVACIVPVITAVWANVHGGWLVGIGVLGLWTGIRILWPNGLSRLQWMAVGVAGLLATLITPYGVELWEFLRQTVGFGRADISEWQPIHPIPARHLGVVAATCRRNRRRALEDPLASRYPPRGCRVAHRGVLAGHAAGALPRPSGRDPDGTGVSRPASEACGGGVERPGSDGGAPRVPHPCVGREQRSSCAAMGASMPTSGGWQTATGADYLRRREAEPDGCSYGSTGASTPSGTSPLGCRCRWTGAAKRSTRRRRCTGCTHSTMPSLVGKRRSPP